MQLTETQQREAATKFYNDWLGKGEEKKHSQKFWIDFCQNVLGIDDVIQKLDFERTVNIHGKIYNIDCYIPETRVLIEQKSIDVDLSKKYRQSDGAELTPFEQGERYSNSMPVDEHAKYIVACNFKTFEIHDMNKPNDPPLVIGLDEVRSKLSYFDFMFKREVRELSHEMEVSVKAGEIVGILYDKLLEQYREPDENSLKSLNALCVRLVFCLYAEDAGIFDAHNHSAFHDYLADIPADKVRKALVDLFEILNTEESKRDKYLKDDNPALAAFPYVNGRLFADDRIEIPPFTEELKTLLLEKASADFDWSDISPTIFGAVFESTLNPETRRSGGMHYTSIENIHKVIDPLFMNELNSEYESIDAIDVKKDRDKKLLAFQEKLAGLKFLDPACGSGNFLTETYISLRTLENKAIERYYGGQQMLGDVINPIKVSIGQFFGIEINDFAVTVAKTALWIAESQMMKETEDIMHKDFDFLPLKTSAKIEEGNALRLDWESVVPKCELNYIMGNPPFVGARWMNKEQKKELETIFAGWKSIGDLDYVSCWYKKIADYIIDTSVRAALVSTNSITQGGAVAILWKPLFEAGVHIDFAHRTFRWDSEAKIKAHVHCVIIGFSIASNVKEKVIYTENDSQVADNINGYLLDADNVFIERRTSPIANVPDINLGGQPIDNGNLVLTEDEKNELIKAEPQAEHFVRYYMMGKDFIDRKPRYCLWLDKADPSILKTCPLILQRVQKVKEFRLKSQRGNTLKAAENPTLFGAPFEANTDYIAIPKVSSENRRYIPMDYLKAEIIPGDKLFVMQGAGLYHFGVLTSNVHMAWMRAVCGRLKSDYSYSNTIVYNNFPWPTPTDEQRTKIEQTAQGILDARALYPDSSLADLYDELTMPPELRKAHIANDKAVMAAYGFPIKDFTEADCVAELMKMYKTLTEI